MDCIVNYAIGFLAIAIHMIHNSYSHFNDKAILFVIVYLVMILIANDILQESSLFMYFSIALLLFSLYKGAPIFAGLGGLFKPGIPIGKTILNAGSGLNTIKVKFHSDFSQLRLVKIVSFEEVKQND